MTPWQGYRLANGTGRVDVPIGENSPKGGWLPMRGEVKVVFGFAFLLTTFQAIASQPPLLGNLLMQVWRAGQNSHNSVKIADSHDILATVLS